VINYPFLGGRVKVRKEEEEEEEEGIYLFIYDIIYS